MSRIMSHGTDDRHHLLKLGAQPGSLLFAPLMPGYKADVLLSQCGKEDVIENPVLLVHQFMGPSADSAKRLPGGSDFPDP